VSLSDAIFGGPLAEWRVIGEAAAQEEAEPAGEPGTTEPEVVGQSLIDDERAARR
jgi:hypothetical protein